MHLYDGRCYKRCPGSTYASEVLTERSSRRRNLTYFPTGDSGSVAKRQGSNPAFSEALDMEPEADKQLKAPLICLPCHYTCATCTGPHSSQCSSCLEDAQLFNVTDAEPKFYCYPKTVLPQITIADWHYRVNVALSIILFVVTSGSLYFLITFFLKRWGCCGVYYDSNINIAYNKLASDEVKQSALEVEDEIHKALNDTSESESEDDLGL